MVDNQKIFALDVGTRTVVGIVLEYSGDGRIEIQAVAVEEHQDRAMLDGQIHDIPRVAQAVIKVKEQIEKQIDDNLKKVAVAAAGRALSTCRAIKKFDISHLKTITAEELLAMQLEVIQEAQVQLFNAENKLNDYHCVGFSVVKQVLDGQEIINPEEQHGQVLEIEIIATFLPRIVVDSLHAVLHKSGLEIQNLTLEPIAASQVVIPATMRKLNIALVDIGAGTSDIAISREGSFCGYEMVDMAGDEITEELCNYLLVDFYEGERVKKLIHGGGNISYHNILGNEETRPSEELCNTIKPCVSQLAKKIAEKIISINGNSPQAVLLIGGGSLTPGVTAAIAANLELPIERVGIRGREAIKDVGGEIPGLESAQAVTPIGIAIAGTSKDTGFNYLTVNGHPVRVFQTKKMTAAEVIMASGVPVRKIVGRPGEGMSIEINGKVQFLRGSAAAPAIIKVNGRRAEMETIVGNSDQIDFQPAVDGKPASGKLSDLVERPDKKVYFNGILKELKVRPAANGKMVRWNQQISDNMKVAFQPLETVEDVLSLLERKIESDEEIFLNGCIGGMQSIVKDGDEILIKKKADSYLENAIEVWINGEKTSLPGREAIFTDVFKFIDIKAKPPKGKKEVVLEVNGQKAMYTTPLKNGDKVTVAWK